LFSSSTDFERSKLQQYKTKVISFAKNLQLYYLPEVSHSKLSQKITNYLTTILGILEKYPAERMNAFPIRMDIEKSGLFTSDKLKPVGERIYT
jgi:hypothetical protein